MVCIIILKTTVIDNITRKSFLYNSIDDKLISGNLFIPQNYNENNSLKSLHKYQSLIYFF